MTTLLQLEEHQVVEALNRRYDELNKLWEAAEKRLKRIPIPMDVTHCYRLQPYSDDPQEYRQIEHHLGFAKHYGGWRLCYCSIVQDRDDDFDWKPISECPLDIRIEAVCEVDKLHKKVVEKAKECVPTIDQAIADLRSKLAEM